MTSVKWYHKLWVILEGIYSRHCFLCDHRFVYNESVIEHWFDKHSEQCKTVGLGGNE